MSVGIPTRMPSGMTNSYPKEILGFYGNSNPFQLHRVEDDFDWIGATGVKYTITAPNGGTLAPTPGDGGKILATTGAVSGNNVSIQGLTGNFQFLKGRRAFFCVRLQMAALSVPSFTAGIMQVTATPGTVTDGIVIEKLTASTTFTLKHYLASVVTASATFPASFLPVAGQDFDIGFLLDQKGRIEGFANTVALGGLFGYYPQNSSYPAAYRGPACATIVVPTLTAVNLTETLAVQTNAASTTTATFDFLMAAQERA